MCLLAQRPADHTQTKRYGRVEMTARDVADRIGHRQHGQTEGEGYSEKADPKIRECRREHRRAAASESQPERAKEFSGNAPRHVRVHGYGLPPNSGHSILNWRGHVGF